MRLKDYTPFGDFFAPIGELTLAFSMLETHLTSTLTLVLGIKPTDALIIAEKIRSIPHRISLLRAVTVCRLTRPELVPYLDDIVADLDSANTHRNLIIHGPWNEFDATTKTATKLRIASKKAFRSVPYSYTPDDIIELSAEIMSLIFSMGLFNGYFAHQSVARPFPWHGRRVRPKPAE